MMTYVDKLGHFLSSIHFRCTNAWLTRKQLHSQCHKQWQHSSCIPGLCSALFHWQRHQTLYISLLLKEVISLYYYTYYILSASCEFFFSENYIKRRQKQKDKTLKRFLKKQQHKKRLTVKNHLNFLAVIIWLQYCISVKH